MSPRQSPQTPAGQSQMACYPPISSDDEIGEMEEDFVVIGDETLGKWDIDQIRCVPLTPLQSAVSTARHCWSNLSLSSVRSRLDTIGTAAAEKLVTAVTGLRPQAASGISSPIPKAIKTPVDDLDGWEPERNTVDKGRAYDWWSSNQGAKIGTEYPRNKVYKRPYADTEHIYNRHNPSPQGHNLKLKTQEAGPRFLEEEQEYDSLGVSTAWQRPVKQEESKQRKQTLLAQWQEQEEKGAYQKHLDTRADVGMPRSAPRKSTNTARKNEEANQQMQPHKYAHTGIRQEEKGRGLAAGMQRDTHVNISLPRSNHVTVQRSSTKRRAGEVSLVNPANRSIQSSVFYGLSAQLRAPPRTHKDSLETDLPDRCWKIDIERLRFCG